MELLLISFFLVFLFLLFFFSVQVRKYDSSSCLVSSNLLLIFLCLLWYFPQLFMVTPQNLTA